MKKSSLEKLKQVLGNYSSNELYQCLSSYPSLTGINISEYLSNKKIYCVSFEKSVCYIPKENEQSNNNYYQIGECLNMGLAA